LFSSDVRFVGSQPVGPEPEADNSVSLLNTVDAGSNMSITVSDNAIGNVIVFTSPALKVSVNE